MLTRLQLDPARMQLITGFFKSYLALNEEKGGEKDIKSNLEWQYNEIHQVGTNYADAAEVQVYDSRMQKLRNIKEEIESIINCLGLTSGQTILDFGSGTGAFALEAAQRCAKVFAVDISPAMLEFTRQKAKLRGIKNVEFQSGPSS